MALFDGQNMTASFKPSLVGSGNMNGFVFFATAETFLEIEMKEEILSVGANDGNHRVRGAAKSHLDKISQMR